ncbi:uncharacterized protein LOC135352372 isoform X2 [Halichondria panicea]|uniref:uncharacterized protein LOC135352372 isoform X2 n=1 Tax=Halichondria panicea TaxID=6063 RepID=UPI00312B7F31
MASYAQQISAPVGAGGGPYFPGNYPPARGPSSTLPATYMHDVPDEAILGFPLRQTIREQGVKKDERAMTLSGMMVNLGPSGHARGNSPNFEDLLLGDEEKKKEREVLQQNRARLTEYVHDCTVLFPYMREKNVFNPSDCDKINHEITGIMKMNTFIDIVLTKRPQAIGVFHESLNKHYPAVFDVLSGLFTNAGVSLPNTRQKKERPEFQDDDTSYEEDDISRTINNRGRRGRDGVRTIRIRLKELSKHCARVQSQRDELQEDIRMREQDIDSLMSRIDRQDAQNGELMSKLQHWRQSLTDQSNGSIRHLGEIIHEKEMIQTEYSELAGELELTVSELMAARDRIGKLLMHLDRTDKQAAATVEANEKLQEKVQMQNGEIQKLLRKIDRLKADGSTHTTTNIVPTDKKIQELEAEVAQLKTDCEQLKEQTAVASRERKYALDEKDQALSKVHTEKSKNSHLKAKVKEIQSMLPVGASINSTLDSVGVVTTPRPTEDTTVFITTEGSGMELGLAVVIRSVGEGSKAHQEGIRVGDEIREVNRVKVTSESCKDPLDFAKQILSSVSQHVVNLTIRRPPVAASANEGVRLRSPLDVKLRGMALRKVSGQSENYSSYPKPNKLFSTHTSAKSSSTSTRSHDTTSGDDTRDSDSLTDQSDSDDDNHGNRALRLTNNSEPSEPGIIDSPRSSVVYNQWCGGHNHETVKGLEFGGEDPTIPIDDYGSLTQDKLIRKRGVRKYRRDKMKLSRSLDDMDKVKFLTHSPNLDDISPELRSHIRQVIIRHGQWGDDFDITGGRGNGLFIESHSDIRGLNTGDQILQIGDYPAKNLTYAEALEMLSGLTESYYFLLVAENKPAYDLVFLSNYQRDHFFVRARYSHYHKTRTDFGLEYIKGDVFHVIDSKPQGYSGYWRVEKVKRSSGEDSDVYDYIPITLDPHDTVESTTSLPIRALNSPRLDQRRSPHAMSYKPVSTRRVYEFYEAIRQVPITRPRPVVLLGGCENEVRQGLVEQGVIHGLKFAFCLREPAEKLEYISPDQIVETVVTDGEVMKSTVDNARGAANQGYHCVLCLRHDELIKPGVASLHPIVLILAPQSRFKGFRDPPNPAVKKSPVLEYQYITRLSRKLEGLVSGEIALNSGMCLDDALAIVRETVAKKQEETVWEADI